MVEPAHIIAAFSAIAIILAIVALIVSCVNASQNDGSTDHNPQYITMSNTGPQEIAASVATPLQFDEELSLSDTGDILYVPTGGIFQVSVSGMYEISVNAAVDVSTSGGPVTSPVSVWVHKSGDTMLYGLTQSLPASTVLSSTNSQYISLNVTIGLAPGDEFSINVMPHTAQTLVGGITTYVSVTRVSGL